MTAAEDLHRRTETETALRRLLRAAQDEPEKPQRFTRKGLFSRTEKYQEALLLRMERADLVEAHRRGAGKPTLYQVKDSEQIQAMLEDDELLLPMVFPSYTSRRQMTLPSDGEASEAEPSEPTASLPSDVSLEMVLKVQLGMAEMLSELMERAKEQKKGIGALQKDMRTLLRELTE